MKRIIPGILIAFGLSASAIAAVLFAPTNSRSSVFAWASEGKVTCGKAYGYLQIGNRDDDYVTECECFYT